MQVLTNDIYQRIVTAKIFIDDNFHEAIDLELISKKAFLSRFHFHRIFCQVYRHTPHQYLTKKRLEKARDLLSKNKPVTEVCSEVGFESVGSFSSLFKKEIGFAPTYYRNMAWLKNRNSFVNRRWPFHIVISNGTSWTKNNIKAL
jgi:AraC-like DNA-binding protein